MFFSLSTDNLFLLIASCMGLKLSGATCSAGSWTLDLIRWKVNFFLSFVLFFVVLYSSTRWVQSTIKLLHCPLTKQCSAVDKSQQNRENKFLKEIILWECRESNPGQLGEKRERYLCVMPHSQVEGSLAECQCAPEFNCDNIDSTLSGQNYNSFVM